jgi:hypothetical protein
MGRLREIRARREHGVATAEYAVATVAACGFGGVLIKLLTSAPMRELLTKVIRNALSLG